MLIFVVSIDSILLLKETQKISKNLSPNQTKTIRTQIEDSKCKQTETKFDLPTLIREGPRIRSNSNDKDLELKSPQFGPY